MNKTFGALDADKQAAFTQDLLALMASRNRSGDAGAAQRVPRSRDRTPLMPAGPAQPARRLPAALSDASITA
jgi:hypothetical protein